MQLLSDSCLLCLMQLNNESGISNSSTQPCKGYLLFFFSIQLYNRTAENVHQAMAVLILTPFIFSGNDPVDEDVDIVGGNDPPVSSYPPVEIEKDAANRNSKCSSSSSSSSDSGSSSSGSCFCVVFICFLVSQFAFNLLKFGEWSGGFPCKPNHFRSVLI